MARRGAVCALAVLLAAVAVAGGSDVPEGVRHGYDSAGRLVSVYVGHAGQEGAVLYEYDAAGNRVRMRTYGPGDSARDQDGDGLSDPAEIRYFGDLAQNGAADPDGDGLVTSNEFIYGGDPTRTDTDSDGLNDLEEAVAGTALDNAGSFFQVADVAPGTGAVVRVSWDARAGRCYEIQGCPLLGDAWDPVSGVITALVDHAHTEERPAGANRFFRLSVTRIGWP